MRRGFRLRRWMRVGLWLRVGFVAPGMSAVGVLQADGTVDFARQIQPIFAEHCLECHGPDQAKGGLNLTTREGALKELKSGAVGVVPGHADESELVQRVMSTDAEDRMPPKEKKPLKPGEAELLRQWIAEGAKFEMHWAYKPLVQPKPPAVKTFGAAVRNDIDRFVIAKLEEKGVRPSTEAERHTLIRRVHYDLLGLPPTPEEVEAFAGDRSPDAYEAMVDRALASDHFGERWGRHWLDMARYADSDGYEKDRPRPDAWRYRDWVIRAINEDMPFDEFTIQQLAGDLLPDATPEQLVATAFNRQTLTNTEGGTDQEQFRVEACFDRTETLGSVWLGLTVGCARCHSHKYDQISQAEYYQLFAFFNNADEVTRQAPETPEAWSEYEKRNGEQARQLIPLQKRVDEAKAALPVRLPEWEKGIQQRLAKARERKVKQTFEPLKVKTLKSEAGATLKMQQDGSVLASGKHGKTDVYTVELEPLTEGLAALQIEVLPDASLPKLGPGRSAGGNFVLSELRVMQADAKGGRVPLLLHSARADFEQKDYKAVGVIDELAETGWGVSGGIGKRHELTVQLAEPAPRGARLIVELQQSYKRGEHCIGRFRLLGSAAETENTIVPPEVVRILNEEPRRRNAVVIKALYDWMEKMDPDVRAAERALKAAEASLPKAPLMDVRVIAQRNANPRATHVLHRGDFLQPADEVVPATLSVLPPMKKAAPSATGEASRLDLARWLVSGRNPLTPRVTVNHFWARLFGEGLVRTPGDFGVRGEPPSHPQLLDWLAAEFIQQGWSRKRLIKTILMSGTYRQQSVTRPELADIDPRNELLHRQNRLRVEGEVVRDLYLAASGLLSPKIGGPSVFPPMPPDLAALSYAGNFSWKNSAGEDRYRRGMYTFLKRTLPHPDLMTFDCPDANLANVKRTVSNTPLQALTTLNAEAFNEAAQALSRRLLMKSVTSDAERIGRLYLICVARLPQANEVATFQDLLNTSREWYASRPNEAHEMTGGYAVKGVAEEESAAWTATVRIVLNLDEFITRE